MNKKIIICFLLILGIIVIFSNQAKKTYAYSVGETLVDVVKAEAGNNVGWNANFSGVTKTSEGDYRYVGANVNNYVLFNNDLYRIIGVFNTNTHGQEGQMVKLIRSRMLGAASWGVYNSSNSSGGYSNFANDWTGDTTGVKANLNVLLNNFFYTKTDPDPIYGLCSRWPYFSNTNNHKTKDCGAVLGYGIDSELRNYISNAKWYLYGYNEVGHSKQEFYMCERGISDDTRNCLVGGTLDVPYSKYTDAKIGLMYASDYLYASSAFGSNDNTLVNNSENQNKYGAQNWLFKGYEWTITPVGGKSNYVYHAYATGILNNDRETRAAAGYRPSFYLKSNVYYTGGSGTFDDPYTIACDDCDE